MVKETIKKTLTLERLAKAINRIYLQFKFTTSSNYWESRYKKGGNSGLGSYNQFAEFKGKVINEFLSKNNIETVIEFGCGDGNQLKYLNCKSYIGFDVSHTIISKCRNIYSTDSTKRFEVLEAYNNEKAELTLSLEVIFHLIEDNIYFDYMERLFFSSNKYVIIYSSNDFYNKAGPHMKYRKFTTWVEKNAPEYKLIKYIPNELPFFKNKPFPRIDFYIFQLQKEK